MINPFNSFTLLRTKEFWKAFGKNFGVSLGLACAWMAVFAALCALIASLLSIEQVNRFFGSGKFVFLPMVCFFLITSLFFYPKKYLSIIIKWIGITLITRIAFPFLFKALFIPFMYHEPGNLEIILFNFFSNAQTTLLLTIWCCFFYLFILLSTLFLYNSIKRTAVLFYRFVLVWLVISFVYFVCINGLVIGILTVVAYHAPVFVLSTLGYAYFFLQPLIFLFIWIPLYFILPVAFSRTIDTFTRTSL